MGEQPVRVEPVVIRFKEAAARSAVWIGLALVFGAACRSTTCSSSRPSSNAFAILGLGAPYVLLAVVLSIRRPARRGQPPRGQTQG
ncbi:hypothetical protein RKD37_004546 [Streptomyces ambofaciens]